MVNEHDKGGPGLGLKHAGSEPSTPQRQPTPERGAGYWRLVLDDGSVLIPPREAGEFQRMALIGLTVLLRRNDGGAVSRGAINVFHALQATATRESERRSAASGAEFSEVGNVRSAGRLTTAQAAERLGVKPRAVRKACHEGRIVGATLVGRDWAIEPEALEDFRHGRRAA